MSKRIKGITIELDGDSKGLDKALSDVNKRSRDVAKELRDVERLLKFNPGNAELVAQKQKLLGDQVEATRDKLNKLKEAEAEVQRQFENGEIGEEQYRDFQREIVETESKLNHFESQLEKSQSKLEKFGEKVGATGEKFKQVGEGMKKAGKKMTTHVTAPLAGLAAMSAKVGIDFQAGMSEVAAISGATGDELDALTETAREWGSKTSFSATEAADGLKYMALAGWDTEKMMSGIGPVLNLAEAGAIDLGKASDLVTDSMAAMGLEVDELEPYLDKVAETARKSNTDIDALMEAVVVAGGTFSRFNVPLEEANAFLGVLANRGTKGTEAGTALNAIMDRLTSGTGQAATALDELGLSAFDSEGNFKGMEATMLEIEDALSGMTDEEKAHYQSMIAGLNHGKSFEKMLQGLGDEYGELKGDIQESDGALQEMRDTMKDNLQGDLENMKSALEEAGISIFENMLPALEKLVGFVQKAADWFNDLSPAIQNTIVVLSAIAAAIGPILIVFGMIASGIGSLMTLFSALTPVFAAVGAAIGAISWPVIAVIAAIAALIAIGVALWKNWDVIKEKAIEIWGSISDFFVGLWDGIKEIFSTAMEFISEKLMGYWESMSEGVSEVWEGITDFFTNIWEIIKNIFVGAFLALLLLVTGRWDELGEATAQIWANITEAISNVWESIKQIFSGALSIITGFVSEHWNNIKEVFGVALDWLDEKTGGKFSKILEVVKKYMQLVWNNIKAVWDYIKGTFTNVLDFIKSLVKGDFQGMKDAINNQMENSKKLIKTIWNNIKSFFSEILGKIWDAIKEKFAKMVVSIAEKMVDALDTVKDIWGKVMDFFEGIDLFEMGKNIIDGLIGGIKSMAGDVVDSVKGVVDGAIDGAKKLLGIKSPSRVFKQIGVYTGEGLELGMRSMGNRVEKAGKRMAESATPNVPGSNVGDYSINGGSTGNGSGNMSDVINAIMELADRDVVIAIDGKELIRATAPGMSEELYNLNKMGARNSGVVY